MSYVRKAGFDRYDDINLARHEARLTVDQCIDLCDITERTWYRWLRDGAPRWAIRLVESQIATLDRFGWQNWEIRAGNLYFNELDHRYFWNPVKLVLPLYNVTDPAVPFDQWADNLSSLQRARDARDSQQLIETPENIPLKRQL